MGFPACQAKRDLIWSRYLAMAQKKIFKKKYLKAPYWQIPSRLNWLLTWFSRSEQFLWTKLPKALTRGKRGLLSDRKASAWASDFSDGFWCFIILPYLTFLSCDMFLSCSEVLSWCRSFSGHLGPRHNEELRKPHYPCPLVFGFSVWFCCLFGFSVFVLWFFSSETSKSEGLTTFLWLQIAVLQNTEYVVYYIWSPCLRGFRDNAFNMLCLRT